jgi:putative hydrolase of the HAD superfamily
MNRIRNIAFDLMGVIITEGHLLRNNLMQKLPAGSNYEEVRKHFDLMVTGKLSETSFWEKVYPGMPITFPQDFVDSFLLEKDTKTTLEILALDYSLGVLSDNVVRWGTGFLKKYDLSDFFDVIILSAAVGFAKPEVEIYKIYIEQSKFEASEILFIDDKLENLKVAKELGMKTMLFDRSDSKSDFVPDFSVKSMTEVLAIFDDLSHKA